QLNADAATFSKQVWDLFMEGSSDIRPFDDAVIDGVDLDIEQGSQMNLIEFANNMNQLYKTGSKKYYLTAAPQCPYPDANLGTLLAQTHVDMAFIHFANKDMKLYVGATAGQNAGNPSSYVSPSFFANELQELQTNYTDSFGGAMLWDMSWAYGSTPNYAASTKQALMAGSRCGGYA
ncbi:Chitinase 2, partial [Coemansia sp. RSA 2049]